MYKPIIASLLIGSMLSAPAWSQDNSFPYTLISEVKEANTRVTAIAIDFGRELPINWQLQPAFEVTAELKPLKSYAGDVLANSAAPLAPRTIVRAYTSDTPKIGSAKPGQYVILELDPADFNASSWYMATIPASARSCPMAMRK